MVGGTRILAAAQEGGMGPEREASPQGDMDNSRKERSGHEMEKVYVGSFGGRAAVYLWLTSHGRGTGGTVCSGRRQ